MQNKKSKACLFARNRIQIYEKWITFCTKKLDELLVTDSELQIGGRQNPCAEGPRSYTRFTPRTFDTSYSVHNIFSCASLVEHLCNIVFV